MDFDADTLRPTYRIVMGSAGSSAGLEMAARLGLPPRIVERAQQRLGGATGEMERWLGRLRQEVAALQQQRESLELAQQELAAEGRRQAERQAAEGVERGRQAARALELALREFREQARQELASAREERERDRLADRLGRSERRLRQVQERHTRELAPQAAGVSRVEWPLPAAPKPGMRIYVLSLEREGELVQQRGERAEVRLGSAVFNVPFSDLRVPPGPQEPATEPRPRPARVVSTRAELDPEHPVELMLVGQRVQEALDALDRFLDGALLAGHDEVRIVHGHGTGRLRDAVRRYLAEHAGVQGQRPGRPNEGGDGVTMVTIGVKS
jgi:DNA mismatch repair protein MutS2